MQYFKFCVVILVLFFAAPKSAAQGQEFAKFEHYNSLNGLPQNEVVSILQDSNEYIWLGTQNGLARFDGKQFIVINKASFPDLGSNRISLMIKNANGILVHPDKDHHSWFRVNSQSTNLEPISTYKAEFYLHNKTAGCDISKMFKPEDHPADSSLARDIQNQNPHPFIFVNGNTAKSGYILHKKNIYYFQNGSAKWIGYYSNSRSFFCLNQHLFVVNAVGELMVFDPDGKVTKLPDYPQFKTKYFATVFSQDQCFLQSDNDLYLLDYANGQLQFRLLGPDLDGHRMISVLYLKHIETIYLGTQDDGFYIYKKRQFTNFFRSGGTEANLTNSNVFYALMPYNGNSILTDNGYFDSMGKFYPKFVNTNPFFLYNNRQGFVLFEREKMLVKMEIATGKISKLDTLPATLGGIDGWKDGSLVYGINDKVYLNRKGKINLIYKSPDESAVGKLRFISENEIWVAGHTGLYKIQIQPAKTEEFPALRGKQIRRIFKDKNGYIWLGTYGDGWYLYYKDKLKLLPVDRLGYLNIVNGLELDTAGFLWVTTNNGMFRFWVKDLYDLKPNGHIPYYNHFGTSYGLASEEFNGGCTPSGIQLPNMNVVFPTLKGLVVFNPYQVRIEESTSPINIDFVRADGVVQSGDSVWRIKAGTDQISISPSVPYLGNPYNLQLEYRFIGSQKNWMAMPEDGKIRLVKLTYGHYKIMIRRPAGFGKNYYYFRIITIIVEPFWYQTTWFYTLLFALALCAGYMLFIMRNRRLIKQRKLLQEEVKERTLEIGLQNTELKERIAEILRNREALTASNLLNERLMASLAHDIRSPLKFQLKASEILATKLKNESDEDISRIAVEIEQNTAGMYHFTGDILAWYLSVNEQQKMDSEDVNLRELVNKCIGFLKFSANMHNNTFVNLLPEESNVHTIRPILEIVIRNLLDNSNKNARNGTISVDMIQEERGCGIMISDNGNGMRMDETESLNLFYLNKTESSMPGFGSYMLRDFIEYLGAEIHYNSTEGVGTTVKLSCLR